jgi:hypothetical protein
MEKKSVPDETKAGIVLIAVMLASMAGIIAFGISAQNMLPAVAFSVSVSAAFVLFGPRAGNGK